MKKITTLIMALTLSLCLCACTTTQSEGSGEEPSQGPTWQEQYDLGVRYLSEGNYEEAIIAFTAAIEIDPKQAPAYLGRGDAHSGVAKLSTGDATELPEQAVTSYESAVADYLAAIDLDGADADVYLKAADVYLALGDTENAISILTRGFEATEDERLADKIAEIELSEQPEARGSITFSGDGRNMTMSLTYPDLPDEVLVLGGNDSNTGGHRSDANFTISFSDGIQTFCVSTSVYDEVNPDDTYMTAIPSSSACKHALFTYFNPEPPYTRTGYHINNPVIVTRNNDTITWSFTLPAAGFSISDIRYIGYSINYYQNSESDKTSAKATFEVKNGELIYLNDGIIENLGFIISYAEFDALYR